MPLTHYVVIRRDLTFGEYSAQLAHAGEAYYMRAKYERPEHPMFSPATPSMAYNQTVCIVKGIRNEGRLRKLENELVGAGVPHIAIREEAGEKGGRLAGQLTCISIMPNDREKVEPFVREIHTIEGLDAPKQLPK